MFDGENVPVWRPVTLYRTVTDSQDRNVPRTNLPAAQPWDTPSTLDQATVLAEDLTGRGHVTRVVGNEPRFYAIVPLTGA